MKKKKEAVVVFLFLAVPPIAFAISAIWWLFHPWWRAYRGVWVWVVVCTLAFVFLLSMVVRVSIILVLEGKIAKIEKELQEQIEEEERRRKTYNPAQGRVPALQQEKNRLVAQVKRLRA